MIDARHSGEGWLLRDGDQLELLLFDVRRRIPWEGRSPRGLTRAAQVFILKAGAAKKRERSRGCRGQLELFSHQKGPGATFKSVGAPLLVPLKREGHRG